MVDRGAGSSAKAASSRSRVDLETAVRQRLLTNAAKYPVEKAKGVATKWAGCTGLFVPVAILSFAVLTAFLSWHGKHR